VRILVKLGGTLLDEPASRRRLAEELSALQRNGTDLVVVHGGGKQMTRFLAERGVESRFIDGLRVTTPEVVDAVLKVFAGSVNHELVSAFVAAGAKAVGLSGIDAALAEAVPLGEELGAVGRIVRSNAELLRLLTSNGYLPVVACVAGDRMGRVYNVNADQMATACAAGFGADKLLFLTDVEGVRGAGGGFVPALTSAEAGRLIADGVATGGMQAKLTAAIEGLEKGIGEVLIAPGGAPGIVGRIVASGAAAGTRLVRDLESPGGKGV
jgi:acetylglutamate kinase